jgi:hypothetical protein
VASESVHGLFRGLVESVGGVCSKDFALGGSNEPAYRHRKAVHSREARVYPSPRTSPKASKEAPVKHGFYRPQVRRLADESGTVDLLQTRKEVFVMPPEVGEYRRVGVFLQKLPYKFAGENDAVVDRWVWASGTEGTPLLPKLLFEIGEHLIGETKHLDNEAIEVHDWRKGLISGVQCSQPEIRASPVCFLPSKTRTPG